MASFANLALAQSSGKSYTRHLRRKKAFSKLSAFNISPLDPVQSMTGALGASINTMRQSNREAVIIHNVLYPSGSPMDSGTSGTGFISYKSHFEVGGRKLRKKSLLHFPAEMLKLGRVTPLLLPSDYLDAEEASREATLLRISALSTSRLTSRQMQNGEAGTNTRKQAYAAPAARICAALSSHLVTVRDPVSSAPGPHVITADTRRISAAFGRVYHPRRNGHACTQKRIKFKPVLESMEETCEHLDPGHV
jgi:hypothetical protein